MEAESHRKSDDYLRSMRRSIKATDPTGKPITATTLFERQSRDGMSSTAQAGVLNPKTQMTHTEMKAFVRDHFQEFIHRKNLDIADVNFATPDFVEHGTD